MAGKYAIAFLVFWSGALVAPLVVRHILHPAGLVQYAGFDMRGEKRNPAQRPSLRRNSSRRVAPSEFGKALEAWYDDSFPWRTELLAFHRRFSFEVLKNPVGQTVPGYGNWTFRRGGTWAELDDYIGALELTPQELADWVALFEGEREWAHAIGSHFITLPAPVKAQCRWQELFPAIRRHRGRNVSSQVAEALESSVARDDVVFAAQAFDQAFAAGRETFFESDHHPTAYGVWLLYEALNRRLAELFPGKVSPSFPWYDDPPPEVREGRAPGCWLEEAEPRYRMVVSSPGEIEDDDGVTHNAARYPYCHVATVREGGGISIVMAHDSYMRFTLASWRGKDGDVRFPFAQGVGRVRAWIFGRTSWGFLLDATTTSIPDVIIEQFPEFRLDGTARSRTSPVMRAAAVFARSREPDVALELPPPGSRVAVRIVADGLSGNAAEAPAIVLSCGERVLAREATPAGVRRAVFFDVTIPEDAPARLAASISGGSADLIRMDWRLAGE